LLVDELSWLSPVEIASRAENLNRILGAAGVDGVGGVGATGVRAVLAGMESGRSDSEIGPGTGFVTVVVAGVGVGFMLAKVPDTTGAAFNAARLLIEGADAVLVPTGLRCTGAIDGAGFIGAADVDAATFVEAPFAATDTCAAGDGAFAGVAAASSAAGSKLEPILDRMLGLIGAADGPGAE